MFYPYNKKFGFRHCNFFFKISHNRSLKNQNFKKKRHSKNGLLKSNLKKKKLQRGNKKNVTYVTLVKQH